MTFTIANTKTNCVIFDDATVEDFGDWFLDSTYSEDWEEAHRYKKRAILLRELRKLACTTVKKNYQFFDFNLFRFYRYV